MAMAFSVRMLPQVERAFEARFCQAAAGERHGRNGGASRAGLRPSRTGGRGAESGSARGQVAARYLEANRIPFFAFRQAVPGKATGAHIHLGPMSTRLAHGG